MRYRALIPVKRLNEAKSRLAPYLTPRQREALMLDMLHHVIYTLRESNIFEYIAVISADARVLKQAQAWGAQARHEEVDGHNPALQAAARQEMAAGAAGLLTISADLPLLHHYDIQDMVERARQYAVVLAPSQDGTGTNAVFVQPPLAVPYVFGPGSLQRFISEAKERHLSHTLYSSLGLGLDIDTIDDLELFRRYERERLSGIGINPQTR